MADYVGENMSSADNSAGAAPADTNKPISRPSSVTRDLRAPFDTSDQDENSSETGGAGRDPSERLRLVRERQNVERQRKLEELKAAALAAQRYRTQRDDERRRRIEDMRARDTDRRQQVEERKRAINEAERARREALLRRDRERDARIEGRRSSRPGSAGGAVPQHSFAFGSSTPRMLEPADTGGTFWGHRRATSTSNVMFAALPLARRPSERELCNIDGDKKRATSAGGLDKDEDNVENSPPAVWSSVARRRTDLVPTIPARDSPRYAPTASHSQSSGTHSQGGRAYSMTRLDQLARPRRPQPPSTTATSSAPAVPPRRSHHRSMVHLPSPPSAPPRRHRADNAGLKSGEQTPGSLSSRPGSSLSGAAGSASALIGVAPTITPRRPRSTPRKPRPASIAGTGVTTPPSELKLQTSRADKPPLPRVHSAANRKSIVGMPLVPSTNPQSSAEKPEPPKRTHKTPTKPAPRQMPTKTMQSSMTEEKPLPKTVELKTHNEIETTTVTDNGSLTTTYTSSVEAVTNSVSEKVINGALDNIRNDAAAAFNTAVVNNVISNNVITNTVNTAITNGNVSSERSLVEIVKGEAIENAPQVNVETALPVTREPSQAKEDSKTEHESALNKSQDLSQSSDPLDYADMSGSLMSRSNRVITTEGEAKAALAERRRLAREEAERQAEKERLRLIREAEEEAERQRAEEERQRRLEEEAHALAAAARQAEEARLHAAIEEAEAQRRADEERKVEEAAARAAREVAEREARDQAERARKDAAVRAARDDAEREARRKRVEAIMLRTRQAKAKKDGEKSPTEDSKGVMGDNENDTEKSSENLSQSFVEEVIHQDNTIAYENSVREREEMLFNHSAAHNQTQLKDSNSSVQNQNGGTNNINNANGDNLIDVANNYASQNGHKKSESNGIHNLINSSSQYNNLTLDNAVKQNNVTNNLMDFSEFENLNTTNSNNPFLSSIMNGSSQQSQDLANVNQIIDISMDNQTSPIKGLSNEDTLNSNATSNSPFITSFQNNQENRDLSLL